MSAETAALEAATIRQQCKVLHMPTIAAQCAQLAEQAVRERRSHLGYLEVLLQAELEEREQRLIERRIREARLPRMKTLEEFDFVRNPNCPRFKNALILLVLILLVELNRSNRRSPECHASLGTIQRF